MQVLVFLLILAGSLLLTLFTYVTRLYSERDRFVIRGSKDNVAFFEEEVEPKLRLPVEQAAWTFPLLVHLNLLSLGLIIAAWNLGKPFDWLVIAQEVSLLVLLDVLFGLVAPNVLLARTQGRWLRYWIGTLRTAVRVVSPLVAIGQVLYRIAMLGNPMEEEEHAAPSASENIEALMQAGEEEGLLEKEDRRLIQSVVEFGDTTVREVMTPRQSIVAVPAGTTLSELRQMVAKRRYTRIPVFEQDLDHTIGFVHAGDLFAVDEEEAERQTVRELVRPIPFVPETKKIAGLLQELQQKAQIAMVVDEYGSVAGLVTVEDMVEEIVGEIRDEHEPAEVIQESEGRYSIPGDMDLDRLQELFHFDLGETGEARTVSGLLTDTLGRVPSVGETLERDGVVFRVTDANGRRVVRLLVSAKETPPDSALPPTEAPSQKSAGTAKLFEI